MLFDYRIEFCSDALLHLPFLTDISLTSSLLLIVQLTGQLSNVTIGESDRRRRMLVLWQVVISRWRGVAARDGDPRATIRLHVRQRRTTGTSTTGSSSGSVARIRRPSRGAKATSKEISEAVAEAGLAAVTEERHSAF